MFGFLFGLVRFGVRATFILVGGCLLVFATIRATDAMSSTSVARVSDAEVVAPSVVAQEEFDGGGDVVDDVFRRAAALPREKRRIFLLMRACDRNLTEEAARRIRTVMSLID